MKKEQIAKIVIIGEARVGKTSILTRYTDGNFSETMMPTLGIDYRFKRVDVNGQEIKLQIWDTAGQERFKAITQNFYKGALGIILVFDLNDPSSLDNLKTWLESIRVFQTQEVVKVIFANKADLQQKISEETIKCLEEQYNIPIFKMSAKNNERIEEAFFYLAKQIKQEFLSQIQVVEEGDRTIFQNEDGNTNLTRSTNSHSQKEGCC